MRDEVWAAQKQRGKEQGSRSPAFKELVEAVTQPFLQVISDASSPQAVFHGGRVLLVGDALSLLRPHTGKAISQATTHCLLLDKYLGGEIQIDEWERRCLGLGLVDRLESIAWGHFYMSNRWQWCVAALRYRLVWYWKQLSGGKELGRVDN